MRLNVRRWGVFNLVGLGGFLVQIATIALLTRAWGVSSIVATACGLELAALQNFFGHSQWTWRERRAPSCRGWLRQYWRYQVAKTASLAANLAITALLIYTGLAPEIANTAAVLLCALPNYFISERYVFGYTSGPCSQDATSSRPEWLGVQGCLMPTRLMRPPRSRKPE